jgi:hypothetical protein
MTFYREHIEKYIETNRTKLNYIFNKAWEGVSGGEINQLKEFLTKKDVGVDFLNQNLKTIKDKDLTVQLSSVYSHCSPKVDFIYEKQPYNRELADLLVILRINETYSKPQNIYSSSFFSQWKLNENDNKNYGQKYLYDFASCFNMPKWLSNYKNGVYRKFGEKEKSLNFFYLDNKDFLKRPNGKSKIQFSDLMLDMLKHKYGLCFNSSIWNNEMENSYDGWDEIMYDLIKRIGKRKIRGIPQSKLIQFQISNRSINLEIENELKNYDENSFQSILIIDVNFNRRLKMEHLDIIQDSSFNNV